MNLYNPTLPRPPREKKPCPDVKKREWTIEKHPSGFAIYQDGKLFSVKSTREQAEKRVKKMQREEVA